MGQWHGPFKYHIRYIMSSMTHEEINQFGMKSFIDLPKSEISYHDGKQNLTREACFSNIK